MDYKIATLKKLREMLKLLEEEHPDIYFYKDKEEVLKDLYEFSKDESKISKEECDYFAIKLIASLKDSHTALMPQEKCLPFEFRIISNKLFIVDCNEDYTDYKGKEIINVNGVPISNILNDIYPLVPFNTVENWKYSEATNLLQNMVILKMLPSLTKADNFTFKFSDNKSVQFNVNKPIPFKNINSFSLEDSIMNIKLKTLNVSKEKMDNYLTEIINLSSSNNVNKFVIDLRSNVGGNSSLIAPFINFVKNKNTVVLVDDKTFSSSIQSVTKLKDNGSKVVGTNMGSTLNHFGECKYKKMDKTGLTLQYSTRYFTRLSKQDYDKNNSKSNSEWSANRLNRLTKEQLKQMKKYSEYYKYFKPDVFVPDFYVNYNLNDIYGKQYMLQAKEVLVKERKI